jgi:hypothetical protein
MEAYCNPIRFSIDADIGNIVVEFDFLLLNFI